MSRGRDGNTGSNTRDINAGQRVQLALTLRAQRLSWDEIASRAGYASRGAAHNAVQRELQRRIVSDVDEYRQQELDFLDTLHQKIWPLVFENPKGKPDLWAADRLLALSVARRQLLNLDIKPKEEISQQNYTKRIILTHSTGGQDDSSDG